MGAKELPDLPARIGPDLGMAAGAPLLLGPNPLQS